LVERGEPGADTPGMNPQHNNHEDLPAAARGRVANRYMASGAYRATQEEREALLEAARRAAREAELADVRPVDAWSSAVSGAAFLLLVGGLLGCAIVALVRWIGGAM